MTDIPRIDINKLKRPTKKRETRHFPEPLQDDLLLPVTLEYPVYLHEAAAIASYAAELLEYWRDPATGVSRMPPVDGEQTTMDQVYAWSLAVLEKLQPQPPVYDLFALNELAVKMPNALAAASEWAQSLLPNMEQKGGGRSRATTAAASSRSPSSSSASIPNSPPGATSSSGASTNGSAGSVSISEDQRLGAEAAASLMASARDG